MAHMIETFPWHDETGYGRVEVYSIWPWEQSKFLGKGFTINRSYNPMNPFDRLFSWFEPTAVRRITQFEYSIVHPADALPAIR